MTFVSAPSSPPAGETPIVNDGWFPNIDLALLRKAVRIDSNVTLERLRGSAIEAISDANKQLDAWKVLQVDAGHDSLAEVPARQVAGASAKVAQYRRAIHALTAADLAARLRDIGTTAAGHDRADELETTEDAHRRAAAWAIADIQDKSRAAVELI